MKLTVMRTKGIEFINLDYASALPLVKCGAYFYIALSFVDLIYPDFKLHLLFMPPRMSASNIFFYALRNQENIILKLTMTMQNLLLPIFLIYLNILVIQNRKFKAVSMFLLVVYFNFVAREYISRNEILRHVLLIIALLLIVKDHGILITKKVMAMCTLFVCAMIPIFLGLQSYRLGGNFIVSSFTSSLLRLWQVEADYSKYFSMLQEPLISIKDYLLWLTCLPIPSVFWPGKPAVHINDVFTEHILGLRRGDPSYTVILPSVLGESFMIFGIHAYWLQAILCGAISAYLFKSLYRNRYLQLNFFYFLLLFLFIGRGGTSSVIPPLINGVVAIVIFCFAVRVAYSAKDKVSSDA